MRVKKLSTLYFSPTGTTRKVVEAIAGSIKCEKMESVDFTSKKIRENAWNDCNSDLVIIGSPVYYGRIPDEVTQFFTNIHVNNVHAILVVVYGNRAYEDALKELYDRAISAGFIPVACAAFIGEHSYSSAKLPMAPGRPDRGDLEKARQFGAAIQEKLDVLISCDNTHQVIIPGSSDYKPMPQYPVAPGTNMEQCTLCDLCIEACPVEAISTDDESGLKTDVNLCILCFACVKICPVEARGIDHELWTQAMEALQKMCLERKEPEVYF